MKRYYQFEDTEYCYFLKCVVVVYPCYVLEYWSRKINMNEQEGLIELIARWQITLKH